MFGKTKLGDSVAAEMDRLLGDAEFKSVFEKPELNEEYSSALANDASYRAFVRIASKQDDGEIVSEKEQKALALQYIVESLTKTSEALDNLGLEKSATVTLAIVNGIFKEAQEFEDESLKSRVDELETASAGDLLSEEEPVEPVEDDDIVSSPDEVPLPPEAKPQPPQAPKESPAEPVDIFSADDKKDEDEEDEEDEEEDDKKEDDDSDECGMSMASMSGIGSLVVKAGTLYFVDARGRAKKVVVAKAAADDKEAKKAKKECVTAVKQVIKNHGCKGSAKATDKGIEVNCKGEKKSCDKCCKEVKDVCKKHSVKCVLNKEYVESKKAAFITDKKVISAMKALDAWVKED